MAGSCRSQFDKIHPIVVVPSIPFSTRPFPGFKLHYELLLLALSPTVGPVLLQNRE